MTNFAFGTEYEYICNTIMSSIILMMLIYLKLSMTDNVVMINNKIIVAVLTRCIIFTTFFIIRNHIDFSINGLDTGGSFKDVNITTTPLTVQN